MEEPSLLCIFLVYVASFRNRKLKLPENPDELYEIDLDKESVTEVDIVQHRDFYRFLDKAAIQPSKQAPDPFGHQRPSPWKLCGITQVENAKTILGMIPIFCSAIIMSTCLAQLQTFCIHQGLTMDTRISGSFNLHPPGTNYGYQNLRFLQDPPVPVYDRIIVPLIRRSTGLATGITHFQRIGVGLVLSIASMGVAPLIEVKRKNVANSHNMLDALPVIQPLPMSVFWLSFQYFIFGLADMFTLVGLLEFFYSEAPKSMKSIAISFLRCAMSLGCFLSAVLVDLCNVATRGNTKSGGWLAGNNLNMNDLNLFYWLLAVLSLINFVSYLYWASKFQYKVQAPVVPERNQVRSWV